MNRKQLTLILTAVVVLGALGLWLRQRDVGSYKTTHGRMGQKALGDFDLNAVARVILKQGTNQLHLVQKNEVWTVEERGGYPANFTEVGEFLRKLWDLKVVQPVAVGPSQFERLELAPDKGTNSPTLVELQDKAGKTIKTVALGKKHMRQSGSPSPFGGDEGWPDGRYLMVDNKAESVSLVAETFSNAEPKPETWLNKDFFKVEKVKSAAVTFPVATNSWKLARETESGELKLADAQPEEKLDAAKVSSMPTALSWPSFNDVVVDAKPEVTGLDKPTVAVFETFDGFTYTLKIGNKSGEDAYYLALAVAADLPKERKPGTDEKPEDKEKLDKEFKEKTEKLAEKLKQEKALEPWVFLVSKYTVDGVLKERHTLMSEKKDEPPKTPSATSTPVPVPASNTSSVPLPPLVPELPPLPPAPAASNVLKVTLPPTPPTPTAPAVKPPAPPTPAATNVVRATLPPPPPSPSATNAPAAPPAKPEPPKP